MPDLFARNLRNNATQAERVLWQQLKLLKSEGRHFRRQIPLAGFAADFACHYPRVVVELDGAQHGGAASYDEARTKTLDHQGYTVLRFWNNDVFEALEGVVDRIRNAVRLQTTFTYESSDTERPPPRPSPQGGGRNSLL
jgi:very-short-patch-repair endonuclease